MTAEQPLLELTGLSKSYGGVRALSDVTLALHGGEIHALVGENGAGKSTLIKILSGAVPADAGTVQVAGQSLSTGSVAASEAAGIATIHQESTAFPNLSAEGNIFAGREPRRGVLLDRAAMRRETVALLERLGVGHIRPDAPLGEMPLASRQMVAMARALSRRSRVLILDEPTASLSAREADALFAVLQTLRAEGVALLYVSHRLDEVFALADRVTVLRDGSHVATHLIGGITREALIRQMVGRDVEGAVRPNPPAPFPDKPLRGGKGEETPPLSDPPFPSSFAALTGKGFGGLDPPLLSVQNLTRSGLFEDFSFTLQAGEVVGLGGLVGAGRSEVARAIFGADRLTGGSVQVDGKPVTPGSIAAGIKSGIALVPEDRQEQGLVLPFAVGDNLALVALRGLASWGGVRSAKREGQVVGQQMREMAVRAASTALPARALSGGNQQKLVLGKWLAVTPRVLILDEPTRGVDVGAKAEIYRKIRELAQSGMATLLISSDLPELLALSDRILVMRGGRIAGELSRSEATEERVLTLALGTPEENAIAA